MWVAPGGCAGAKLAPFSGTGPLPGQFGSRGTVLMAKWRGDDRCGRGARGGPGGTARGLARAREKGPGKVGPTRGRRPELAFAQGR